MGRHEPLIGHDRDSLEIIAFRLHSQEFCVMTTTIREIRGWSPSTPVPQSPSEVMGVINLRGTVIPIIDLARKLGMVSNEKHRNVIRSILDLNRNLGIPSTAEGIETDGQYDDLRNTGCAFGQVSLFSKAISAENVLTLLLNQQQGAVHNAG